MINRDLYLLLIKSHLAGLEVLCTHDLLQKYSENVEILKEKLGKLGNFPTIHKLACFFEDVLLQTSQFNSIIKDAAY
jgi:hypothetical protein